MIAALLSPPDGLLVVREERTSLPILSKNGRLAPENMTLVAQMSGERHEAFAERVIHRAHRAVGQGHSMRAVVFSVEGSATPTMLESRRQLLSRLAEMLASGPGAELTIQAPSNVGAADRVALFELVELTLRAAPELHVRLTFAESVDNRANRPNPVWRDRPVAEA